MISDKQLKALNERLKETKQRVRVEIKGRKLCLRATLPVRDDGPRQTKQQRIYLQLDDEEENLNRVELLARQLHEEIIDFTFSWSNWLNEAEEEKKGESAAELIKRFEKYYWEGRARTKQAEYTWRGDYMLYFRKLNLEKPLTLSGIKAALKTYETDTRSRDRAYQRYKTLAKFADFNMNEFEKQLKPLKGHYRIGGENGIIRNLPSDGQIEDIYESLTNESLKWIFGCLATWGLRPHELWLIDPETIKQSYRGCITVLPKQNGVVGKGKYARARVVPPLRTEWYQKWQLWQMRLPVSQRKVGRDLGTMICRRFKRNRLPFTPYTLRHAWAVRALYEGWEIAFAAHAMGHSTQVHERTYLYWINEHQTRKQLIDRLC